jgi:glycerate kinase
LQITLAYRIFIIMKIIIASDSFKESARAIDACQAMANGVTNADSSINVQIFPLADGGEGTSEIMTFYASGTTIWVETKDPIGRSITANYGISGDENTAFIDMASASGLQLLAHEERNPLKTSTFGTGMMIKHAMEKGVKKIILGIGGSATNDAGIGMAKALGYRFYDEAGNELDCNGCDLGKVSNYEVDEKLLENLPEIQVLADVNNPLYGHQGAAFIYGKQKGASGKDILFLNQGLQSIAKVVSEHTGESYEQHSGAGAAGGLGFGAEVFLNATIIPGAETVMNSSGIEKAIEEADFIYTGEGTIDEQTKNGKLISGICQIAAKHNVPVIGFCGNLNVTVSDLKTIGLQAAFSILNEPMDLSTALLRTEILLKKSAENVTRLILAGKQ